MDSKARRILQTAGKKQMIRALNLEMLLEWKREGRGQKKDAGIEEEMGCKSAKVALIVLYVFLDAEKHGGEPLVQSRNGVEFLHLEIFTKSPQNVRKILKKMPA